MNKVVLLIGLNIITLIGGTFAQNKKQMNNETAIEKLLLNYQDALNAADVAKVLPLYIKDGVFMPQGGPSAIGQEALKGSYEFVFKTLQLKIKFHIDEIVLVNDDYAFARTVSRGTVLVHATGVTGAEENRELFLLQKENGEWKIARYIFNKMK